MKHIIAMLVLSSLLLTACATPSENVDGVVDNTAHTQMETGETGTTNENAVNGEEEPASHLELSETFQTLLDEVNAAHEAVKLYDGAYEPYTELIKDPDFNFSLYNYTPTSSTDNSAVLTLEQITEDMELYYTALRTQYGAYAYFGGDEAFRPAIDAVVADCAALEVITCGDVLDSMEKHFAFVKDAHFTVGGRVMSEYAVPFFFRNVAYQKTERGYETEDGKIVSAVDGQENLDNLFKLSLTKEGELVYYPIILESFPWMELFNRECRCSASTLTVRYTDGSSDKLITSSYRLSYPFSSVAADVREENGIPVVAVNAMDYASGGMKFVDSARDYRNRDIMVMDLRACVGGSIDMTSGWFQNYAQGRVWANSLYMLRGELDANYDYALSHGDEEFVSMDSTRIVLTSKYTASAGEYFVDMGHNLENTLVIGENTRGWLTSSSIYMKLPNSGLYMTFGDALLLHPDNGHFEEYRGFYPDIWVPQAEAEEAVMNFIAKNTNPITE